MRVYPFFFVRILEVPVYCGSLGGQCVDMCPRARKGDSVGMTDHDRL